MATGTLEQQEAFVLAGRICAAASRVACSESELLELVGEFDAGDGVGFWTDVKSLAHWLSWACSMAPGTAREHVRVARALRRMPTVATAFREGRLSFSKVREATRVVDVVDEAELCALASEATASQLARMISGFRTAAGTRMPQERKRALSWTERDDDLVDVRVRLPKEEAAVVIAALDAAKGQFGAPPGRAGSAERNAAPVYGYPDALLDVARGFLAATPKDRSGEDRTLVVVHVAAEHLVAAGDVPAGTFPAPGVPASADATVSALASPRPKTGSDVPAGTSPPPWSTCHVQGQGGIEAATAQRLACDADVIGAVIGDTGEVLALGRSRRLVSRAQRRALMVRDGRCQFLGCDRSRHLKAHHRVAWSDGGPTDLDNLILLCQFHHTAVHEGRMRIVASASGTRRWDFLMPDGRPHQAWRSADGLLSQLVDLPSTGPTGPDGFDHPDARRIRPGWSGDRFDLHSCVQALFAMQLPARQREAA